MLKLFYSLVYGLSIRIKVRERVQDPIRGTDSHKQAETLSVMINSVEVEEGGRSGFCIHFSYRDAEGNLHERLGYMRTKGVHEEDLVIFVTS